MEPTTCPPSLLDVLLQRGIVTPAQLAECEAACPRPASAPAVIEALVARGFLDAAELAALGSLAAPLSRPTERVPSGGHAGETALSNSGCTLGSDGLRRLGRFELLEEIGRGGMGVVWKARDPQLGRIVAIKGLLHGGGGLEAPESTRFLREARSVARLRHPGIIQVHEVSECDGQAFLVMDFIDGRTLMEHLRTAARDGPVDLREGARLVQEAAGAIAYAHGEGIIHRDLKPDNILVGADGHACVGDFGLAKEVGANAARLTESGAVMGTPSYMAPEQAEGRPADARTDVYGLGAVLYEVLTGHPPFESSSYVETLYRVAHDEAIAPSRIDPRVPRDLEVVCLKCLEKEPSRRYASAREAADDLARWRAGEAIRARAASPAYRARRWIARRKALSASLAGLLLLGLAAGGLGWSARNAAREGRRSVLESNFYRLHQVRIVEAVERRRIGRPELLRSVMRTTVEAAERQLAEDPGSAAAWFVKGWILRLGGRTEDAVTALGEAVRRMPEDASARYELGLARAELYRATRREALRRRRSTLAAAEGLGESDPGDEELAAQRPDLPALRAAAEEEFRILDLLARGDQAAGLPAGVAECGRGLLALYRGRVDEAERLLRAAAGKDDVRDEIRDGLLELAQVRMRARTITLDDVEKEYDAAIAVNRGRWSLFAGRADARKTLAGIVWTRRGKLEKARELRDGARADAEEAVHLEPERAEPWRVRCEVLFEEAETREELGADARPLAKQAIECAERARTLEPRSAEVLASRGRAYQILGRMEAQRGGDARAALAQAIASCDEALALDVDNAPARVFRGNARLVRAQVVEAAGEDPHDDLARAIDDFGAAWKRDPGLEPACRSNRGLAYVQLGEAEIARGGDCESSFRLALEEFDRVEKLSPTYVRVHLHRSTAFLGRARARESHGIDPTDDLRAATAECSRAIEINPEMLHARINRAKALRALGQLALGRGEDGTEPLAAALVDCDQVLLAYPGSRPAHEVRAEVLAAQGSMQVAQGKDPRETLRAGVAEYQAVLQFDALDAQTHLNSGAAWHALAEAEQAHGGDPRAAYEQAAATFETALRLRPGYPDALVNLGNARLSIGQGRRARGEDPAADYARALAAFDEALAEKPNMPEAFYGRGCVRLDLARIEKSGLEAVVALLEQAIADMDATANAAPAYWQAHVTKGILLESLGRPAEAVAEYETAEKRIGKNYPSLQDKLKRARAKAAGDKK